MRSRRRIPDSQLQTLVSRLLESNRPDTDTPVIIATTEGDYCSAVGRLLERDGARVSALVDTALERERAITVFLPENAYVGEVVSCIPQRDRFTIDLILIQTKVATPEN